MRDNVLEVATGPAARVTQSRAGASMMLNTSGAGNMAEAADLSVEPVMLIAGDDAGRKPG
jgi:hypothetical protein